MEIERKRIAGWESQLIRHIADHFGVSFRWGQTDCAMFCAGAVQAVTGVDLARGLRGYRSESEGLRKVASKGFKDHEDVFAQALPQIDLSRVMIGDLVAVEQGGRFAMGVVGGGNVRVMAPAGLVTVSLSSAVRGYAV